MKSSLSLRPAFAAAVCKKLAGARPRRPHFVVRASLEPVNSLLERDMRAKELSVDEDAFTDPASPFTAVTEEDAASALPPPPEPVERPSTSASTSGASTTGPRRCREAIDAGMEAFAAGDTQGALALFQLALELPGSGVMRKEGTVREIACPSDGEEQAALYNMACCYCRLGARDSALTCLEAALESGFAEYDAVRSDPDLAALRGPELEKLLGRFQNPLAKVFGAFRK